MSQEADRQEWLLSTDPAAMLRLLRSRSLITERKARLFGAACCRRLWPLLSEEGRRAVEAVEREADGLAERDGVDAVRRVFLSGIREGSGPVFLANAAVSYLLAEAGPDPAGYALDLSPWAAQAGGDPSTELAAQADILRCLFGSPPFQEAAARPEWLSFNGGVVPRLARGIHEEGAFDRLPILADALEESGCTDAEVLDHLRGAGLHVCGCFVLDRLLGKGSAPTSAAAGSEGEVLRLLRFRPSRAEGLPDVREVVVHPERLEVNTAGSWRSFSFSRIGRRQEPRVMSLVKRLVGRTPWPVMVADRDWFHPPRDRFFRWYTDPPLLTCMPEDEPADYVASNFFRIQRVLSLGGYATFDLG